MKLNSTFQKISARFNIDFDQLAAEHNHNLTSGEAREHALIELLRQYLPSRVGVDRGFVIDAHGNESQQMDIVIFDRTVGTVFKANNVNYFPCEIVIAVGEVKSDICSSTKLADSLSKIASAKRLDRGNDGNNLIVTGPGISLAPIRFDSATNYRDQILGFIFTKTTMQRATVISCLQEANLRTDRRIWPNVFCAYGDFLISYEIPGSLSPSAMDAINIYCTEDSEATNLLLLFYCILASFTNEAHVARPNFFDYGGIQSTKATYHECAAEGS